MRWENFQRVGLKTRRFWRFPPTGTYPKIITKCLTYVTIHIWMKQDVYRTPDPLIVGVRKSKINLEKHWICGVESVSFSLPLESQDHDMVFPSWDFVCMTNLQFVETLFMPANDFSGSRCIFFSPVGVLQIILLLYIVICVLFTFIQ